MTCLLTSAYRYVRLFLRKTATWHRVERLGYYNDISNVDLAIASLLESRAFTGDQTGGVAGQDAAETTQEWSLGKSFSFADDSESHIKTMEEAAALLSLDE